MKYTEEYALTNDIDLFCLDKDRLGIHIASNGSKLAIQFDRDKNLQHQKDFKTYSDGTMQAVVVNIEAIDLILSHCGTIFDDRTSFDNYLSTFYEIASCGYISYDVIGNDGEYALCVEIARPINPKPMEMKDPVFVMQMKDYIKFVSNEELADFYHQK